MVAGIALALVAELFFSSFTISSASKNAKFLETPLPP
jgi:hypothetical protein